MSWDSIANAPQSLRQLQGWTFWILGLLCGGHDFKLGVLSWRCDFKLGYFNDDFSSLLRSAPRCSEIWIFRAELIASQRFRKVPEQRAVWGDLHNYGKNNFDLLHPGDWGGKTAMFIIGMVDAFFQTDFFFILYPQECASAPDRISKGRHQRRPLSNWRTAPSPTNPICRTYIIFSDQL